MRSWVTRVTPAMATTTPPPTAAISRAIPSGMVPVKPRKWTSTFVEFCRMKTIRRIRTRSAAPVATQTALARVSRGAPGAGGEPSPKDGVSVDPSSDGDEGGGPAAMIPTFLASRWPQQNILIVARDSRRDKALDMPVSLWCGEPIDPAVNDNADVAGCSGPDLTTRPRPRRRSPIRHDRPAADPGSGALAERQS